jgi:hypothetical protein
MVSLEGMRGYLELDARTSFLVWESKVLVLS